MTDTTPAEPSTVVGYDANGKPATLDGESRTPTARPTNKQIANVATGAALVVVVAILTAITPDLLGFLGPWAPVAFAGVVALAGFLAGYIKRP